MEKLWSMQVNILLYLYRVYFVTGAPQNSSKYKKVNLG